jgi:uncharacterized membrane protein
MESYLVDWANLLVRWLHLTTGIAWIGSSFYFIWLDNHLEPPKDPKPGQSGELWAVHGGGFYHSEKFSTGPGWIPERLHWFKWEAYFTLISGVLLLAIVYWHGAATMLIDEAVADISVPVAIGISIATLVLGWIAYDLLCKSPLGQRDALFGAVLYLLVVALAFGLAQVFSGRAAYLHVGAMIGTVMVLNVYFIIIPGHQRMVDAVKAGRAPDPEDGRQGKQRSVHNNYLTLPVLFLMISGHYPMTYGHPHAWAILAVIVAAGVLVRHFFNLRHKGRIVIALPAAAAALIAVLAVIIAPRPAPSSAAAEAPPFDTVRTVINERCIACHARKPTREGIAQPPAGVILETPAQIKRFAQKIHEQTVLRPVMPAGNVTEMTDDERKLLAQWFAAGARVD